MKVHTHLYHQPILWDCAIAVLLIAPPFIAAWSIVHMPQPWGWILGLLLLCGSLLVAYGSFIEPRRIVLNKKIIHISGLPAMKIVVVADFHVGPYKQIDFIEDAVRRVNALKPDLILLPGDFIFDHHSDTSHLSPLKNLHAHYGVFASIGNHDSGNHLTLKGFPFDTVDRSNEISGLLQSMNITVLRNESVTLTADTQSFAIAAIDGPWTKLMNVTRALKTIPKHTPTILLAHNPDVVLVKEHAQADLIVSGHTHGGQIRFPFIGPLHIPAETKKKYAQGIFHVSDTTTLAVTHGIGETMARARLFCTPEILLLENMPLSL